MTEEPRRRSSETLRLRNLRNVMTNYYMVLGRGRFYYYFSFYLCMCCSVVVEELCCNMFFYVFSCIDYLVSVGHTCQMIQRFFFLQFFSSSLGMQSF